MHKVQIKRNKFFAIVKMEKKAEKKSGKKKKQFLRIY